LRSTYPRALAFLIMLALTAALAGCGGNTAVSGANDSGPPAADGPGGAVPAVSLAMDDYLGKTVVLYFSFPG